MGVLSCHISWTLARGGGDALGSCTAHLWGQGEERSCARRCTHGVNLSSPAPGRGTAPVIARVSASPVSGAPVTCCLRWGDMPRARHGTAQSLRARPARGQEWHTCGDKAGGPCGQGGSVAFTWPLGPPRRPPRLGRGRGLFYLPSQLAEAPRYAGGAGGGGNIAWSEAASDAPGRPCKAGCGVRPAPAVHPRRPPAPANAPFLPAPLPLQV